MIFSIITASYNNLNGIKKTIESLNSQNCSDYEHIIIDGNSNDGTKEFLLTMNQENRIIVSEPDEGISNAFNKGLNICLGDYVLFLNTGDIFVSCDELRMVKKDIAETPLDVLVYAAKYLDGTLPTDISPKCDEFNWSNAIVAHQSTFVKREVFQRVGSFNEYLKLRMDYDFFFRCFKSNVSHRYIPRVIVSYEKDGACNRNKELFLIEGASVYQLYKKEITKEIIWNLIDVYKKYDSEFYGKLNQRLLETEKQKDKFWDMFLLLEKITLMKNNGSLVDYFIKNEYRKIAIYGFGRLGKVLFELLRDTEVEVLYIIDKNCLNGVLGYNDNWKTVDVIVLTQVDELNEIKEEIREKVDYKVITLFEI